MKSRLLLAAVALTFTLTSGSLLGQVNQFAKDGLEAAKRKDWDRAVDLLRKAVSSEPNDNRNSVNLSLALQERGVARVTKNQLDEGIADLSESLKIKGDNVTAHRFRGYALLTKKDYQHAVEDYDAVIKENANDIEALDRRAYAFTTLKQFDKAIADYSTMIKDKPKDLRGYLGRSYALDVTNQPKLAMDDVNKGLEIDPKNEALLNRKKRLEAIMKAAQAKAAAPGAVGATAPAPVPAASPK